MIKRFTFLLLFSYFSFAHAEDSKIDSLIEKLTTKIAVSQYYFSQIVYPEIAYIRDFYNLPNLSKNDTPFINKLNDFYYKQFYPNIKFLNKNFVITEDCITDDENAKTLDAYKLRQYSLYNNIPLPKDYFKRLELASKQDDLFLGPYYTLNTLYYLKKFRTNLTVLQKQQLDILEQDLSSNLFANYVQNKPWSFRKILAVKVLKINKNALVSTIDLSEIIEIALRQGKPKTNILDMGIFLEDTKDSFLISNIGADKVKELQTVSLLWIILNEKKM